MRWILLAALLLCCGLSFGQSLSIHGETGYFRQGLVTQEGDGTQKRFFSNADPVRPLGIAVRLSRRFWATAAYFKHREYIEYAPAQGQAAGESILRTRNFTGGVYWRLPLFRWVELQPEMLVHLVQYQQTAEPRTVHFAVSSNAGFDDIIATTTFIDPGWRVQPYPRLRLVVKPVKRIHLHLGIGYSLGTKKLQEWTASYLVNGAPQKQAKTWTNGSKYFPSVGASVLFGKLKP